MILFSKSKCCVVLLTLFSLMPGIAHSQDCIATGDLNGDGVLDGDDRDIFFQLAVNFPNLTEPWQADLNGDCIVDIVDVRLAKARTDSCFVSNCLFNVITCCEPVLNLPQNCCNGMRGNVDGDEGELVDIADFISLIDHLYVSNPALFCTEEANINGDPLGINLADLALLMDHLFVFAATTPDAAYSPAFEPLPDCGASVPTLAIDSGNTDTLRLVVTDTQMVGSDLQIELELWSYNDVQALTGVETGFSWNSPNLRIDSATSTPRADGSFIITLMQFDNDNRQFQFVGFCANNFCLGQKVTAQQLATYFMTYSNWTEGDIISFDTARFANTGYSFVGVENLMWFPEFVTSSSFNFCCQGATGNIDCDPSNVVNIADLTLLIDHLFINQSPLCCQKEGNIDGDVDGLVDIADLTHLIDHLFIEFPTTADCK